MTEALKDGTVNEPTVTRAAGRVLYEIVHFAISTAVETRRYGAGY